MISVLIIVFVIAGLEYKALSLGIDGVMFSAAVGALSALGGGVIGYLKGKRRKT